jgi:type II secretion system protein N
MRFKNVLIYIGYSLAFVVSLYLFTLISLPEEEIAKYVIQRYIKPNDIDITYKRASISPDLSLVLKDVEMGVGDVVKKVSLERLKIGVSVFSYLFGKMPLSIRAKGFGGDISVSLGTKKDELFIDVDTDDVDLSQVDYLKEKSGLNLKGILSLSFRVNYNKKESQKNNGAIKISIADVAIKGGKIMGFDAPPVDIGDLKGEIEIKEGKFKVINFKSKGKDVELRITGDGQFTSPPSKGSLNLTLKFKPSQGFIDRQEKIKTLLFGIGNTLDREGFYNFAIKGSISNPTFTPEKKG